jgi:hypothetical protein
MLAPTIEDQQLMPDQHGFGDNGAEGFVAKLSEESGRLEVRADHCEQSVQGTPISGEVILLCVRWYLRYPLAYEHVAELLAERGVAVDPSCIWRWVQHYGKRRDKTP